MSMSDPEVRAAETQKPPPNPFYKRVDQCSLRHGHATLTISAPGGIVDPEDAVDVIEWLEIVMRMLKRQANKAAVAVNEEPAQ